MVLQWESWSLNSLFMPSWQNSFNTRKLWNKLCPTFNFGVLNKLRQKTNRSRRVKYFQLTWTTLKFLLLWGPAWSVFPDRQAPNTEGRVGQPWKCASPKRSVPGPQSKRWSQSRNTPGWPCLSCCCRSKDDEKIYPTRVFLRQNNTNTKEFRK